MTCAMWALALLIRTGQGRSLTMGVTGRRWRGPDPSASMSTDGVVIEMLLPVDDDVLFYGADEQVSEVCGERFIRVPAHGDHEVGQPGAVGVVIAKEREEPGERSEAGPVLFGGAYPPGEYLPRGPLRGGESADPPHDVGEGIKESLVFLGDRDHQRPPVSRPEALPPQAADGAAYLGILEIRGLQVDDVQHRPQRQLPDQEPVITQPGVEGVQNRLHTAAGEDPGDRPGRDRCERAVLPAANRLQIPQGPLRIDEPKVIAERGCTGPALVLRSFLAPAAEDLAGHGADVAVPGRSIQGDGSDEPEARVVGARPRVDVLVEAIGEVPRGEQAKRQRGLHPDVGL